ncbi:hypothetical protein [Salinispira pacifica]|uniref:Uncharacterized protein n=1 Tax=Salinispira pacifica TaxID=1307761 RepID=V5WIQ2_9SPIO|nr:hypothetical protein [Salinispira pacifica]AHC15717.1 hypothetical protein L21SP2_2364 [Salinispira pacifica]
MSEDNQIASHSQRRRPHGLQDIIRNRRRLKHRPGDNSLLNYILFDYWKIRKFAASTGLIVSLPLFRLRIAAKPAQNMEQSIIQQLTIPLTARLGVILDSAWKYVNKYDYNLIVLLQNLCRETEKIRFLNMNTASRHSLEGLKHLEPHLLVYYHSPQLVRKTLDVLSYLHDRMEEVKFSQRETRALVEQLIMFNRIHPSLSQLVLAANMVSSRRYLSMKDLINPLDEPLVSEWEFDVDEVRSAAIKSYIDGLDKSLASVYAGYRSMYRMRYFLPRLDPQTPDLSQLQRFITGIIGPERKGRYSDTYSNIPSYVLDFSNLFQQNFEALLCRDVITSESRKRRIFSELVFSDFFSRLRYNIDQLERIRTQVPFFQILRYMELTNSRRRISSYVEPAGSNETQLLNLIAENLNIFSGMKDRLFSIIHVFADLRGPVQNQAEDGNPDSPGAVTGGENTGAGPNASDIDGNGLAESLEDSAEDVRGQATGNREALRHRQELIRDDNWTGGKTVQEALRSALVLINLYLYEMQEGSVLAELEEESNLRKKIQDLLTMSYRISTPEQITRLKQKYPLDDGAEQNG